MTARTSAVPPVTRPAIVLPDAANFDAMLLQSHWLPDDPFVLTSDVIGYYRTKAAIAAWLQPSTVLEIGVRAGYSALAFHMGHPFSWYAGYDSDRGEWGGVKGYTAHAARWLNSLGIWHRLTIADTQKLASLLEPVGPLDLAHVDGDHSYNGARHDIVLSLNAGAKATVIDDYTYVPAVRAAADDIVKMLDLQCAYVPDPLGRGNLIISNRDSILPPIPE